MAPKILVADDQLHMLRFMQHELEQDGYQLLQVRDGHEVIETALRERPDLMILDILMTAAIPVIVLTSSPHEVMRQEAEFSGADLILTKPFSPTLLRKEIRRLVSKSRPDGTQPVHCS